MINLYDAEKDLILLGAGGHAKVVIDTIQKYGREFNIIGITDNNPEKVNKKLLNVPVIGSDELIEVLYARGLRKAFITLGTVGDCRPRLHLYNLVKSIGFICVNIIHGKSVLSDTVWMGEGNVILAGATLNAEVRIADNCIINTGSIIEHECVIGCNVHIASGVTLSGGVSIGDNCLVGTGASVIQGVCIGANSVIGAGSVVIKDIPPNSTAVGVPAKILKKR